MNKITEILRTLLVHFFEAFYDVSNLFTKLNAIENVEELSRAKC